MNEVIKFMLASNKPLLNEQHLSTMMDKTDQEWQNFVDKVRGMIVTYPGKVFFLGYVNFSVF